MNETCPRCGLRFGREWGYFFGAMYFSYAFGVAGIGAFLALGTALFPERSWVEIVIASTIAFAPFVPASFRASRILWLYFDHLFDPE
jgi:hypothetical protein